MKTIFPTFLGKLFGGAQFEKIEIRPEGIGIATKEDSAIIAFRDLENFSLISGYFWQKLRLDQKSGAKTLLKGISKQASGSLDKEIMEFKIRFEGAQLHLEKNSTQIRELHQWIKDRLDGNYWVANHEIIELQKKADAFESILNIPAAYITEDKSLQKALNSIPQSDSRREAFRKKSNKRFIEDEPKRFEALFNNIESNPLTDAQRLAVITHEDNTRVVAGAGSGKTSVIVAKAGYLLEKGLCSPDQLLLIAFNKSAADEIQQRIKERIGMVVRATTFHALGLSIIGQVTGKNLPLQNQQRTPRNYWKKYNKLSHSYWMMNVPPKLSDIISRVI